MDFYSCFLTLGVVPTAGQVLCQFPLFGGHVCRSALSLLSCCSTSVVCFRGPISHSVSLQSDANSTRAFLVAQSLEMALRLRLNGCPRLSQLVHAGIYFSSFRDKCILKMYTRTASLRPLLSSVPTLSLNPIGIVFVFEVNTPS